MRHSAAPIKPKGLSAGSRGQALDWISKTNNTSASAMVMAALGIHVSQTPFGTHPRTPEDIGWCIVLLRRVPELRRHLDKVGAVSPEWYGITSAWDDIEAAYLGDYKEQQQGTTATKYARTASLLADVVGA